MAILNALKISNFECFKEESIFNLDDATFFIGENNSGKSSIFRALSLFFGEIEFELKFLNKTKFRARKKDFNVCDITVVFDLTNLKNKALKERLLILNKKQDLLSVTHKIIYHDTYTEESFILFGTKKKYDELPEDIQTLIDCVKINYIHPQQGSNLLLQAQEKLRKRLLDNWGRSTKLSNEYNKLDKEWKKYKDEADIYLSKILTERIKKFWGKGKVTINLPKSIKEIIKIGDVNFQADESLPEISLTSHGTGVQQSLLYYASYILDSDRTVPRNKEYHPVWLLEEPESFLHADMIIKLAKDLTSSEWLESLQLLSTTHSGLLLANSLNIKNNILWNILHKHQLMSSYNPNTIDEVKIKEIGNLMGDPNFDVYFSINKTPVIIEDTSPIIIKKFEEKGIPIKGVGGNGELHKYLTVLSSTNITKVYFILDNDLGFKRLESFFSRETPIPLSDGFSQFILSKNVFVLLLPKGFAIESIFEGYDNFIDDGVKSIVDVNKKLLNNIPRVYGSVSAKLSGKYPGGTVTSFEEIKEFLMRDDQVKREFWSKIKDGVYEFRIRYLEIINQFLKN